jgi:hypothetical protein
MYRYYLHSVITASDTAVHQADWPRERIVSRYNLAMQVTVDIPDQFVRNIVSEGTDAARRLLEDSVAASYRERRLTMEQVRQLLGFATRMEVDPFLQRYEIYDYSIDDLREDMAGLDDMLGARPKRKFA